MSDYDKGMLNAYGVGKPNPDDAFAYAKGTGGVSDYNKGMQHAMGVGKPNPADVHKYAQGTGGVSDYDKGMAHALGGAAKPNPMDAHAYARGTGGVSDYDKGMQHAMGNVGDGSRAEQVRKALEGYDKGMLNAFGNVGDGLKAEQAREAESPNVASEDAGSRNEYYDEMINRAADDYLNEWGGKDTAEAKDAWAAYGEQVDELVEQRDAYNRAAMGVDKSMSDSETDSQMDGNTRSGDLPDGEGQVSGEDDKPIAPTQSMLDDMFFAGGEGASEVQSELLYNSYLDLMSIKTVLQKYENAYEQIENIENIPFVTTEQDIIDEIDKVNEMLLEETGLTYEEAAGNLENIEGVIEKEEYTLAVQGRIDEELGDSSQISLVDWTNINDPELVDEDKEAIMNADLEDLGFSELVSRVEYDFETLLKEVEQEVIDEGQRGFDVALQKWKEGEDFFIKDVIFLTYGEHIDLDKINLNDLRNDYVEHIWESNQVDEILTNRVDEYITGRIEPYLLEKANYEVTDDGYTFEIPPNFAEYMVAYSEENEQTKKYQGQAITIGTIIAGLGTAGFGFIPALVVGAVIASAGAFAGDKIADRADEWDDIAGAIRNHDIKDSNLIITVTFGADGEPEANVDDRKE